MPNNLLAEKAPSLLDEAKRAEYTKLRYPSVDWYVRMASTDVSCQNYDGAFFTVDWRKGVITDVWEIYVHTWFVRWCPGRCIQVLGL